MKRTGAQIVCDVLVKEGVEVVFGYPGGAIMPLYDALYDANLKHVLVRHEQGAGHMADGYARASGKVGVALATSGPGSTNLVTAIATAMMDSSPVVFITGQVPSHLIGTDAFQETDITGVTIPITKHNMLVTRVEDIAPSLREAFHIARTGRPGPVHIDITKDAQQALYEVPAVEAEVQLPMKRMPRRAPVPADFDQAAAMIEAAERPIIFAGHGVLKAGATEELLAFAEKTGVPVAATLLGLGGFPASHPLALGMMGMHGEVWVNAAIQEADLIIAIGMRFDDRVTGNLKTYAKKAKKIHIEIDHAEIDKIVKVECPLYLDAKVALNELLARVAAKERRAWMTWIEQRKAAGTGLDILGRPADGKLYAAHVLHDLWRITEGKAVVVTDVGQHQMWEAQYYRHDRPRSLITSGGFGTMGFALPAAIGAKFGCPDAEVWVVAGDGGFQMTSCELATIAQEGIKINIAIINNGYLGMVRQWQEFFYDGRYSNTPITSPDFVKLAEAYGLPGIRVERREDLPSLVARARAAKEAVVIDFRVEQEDSVYPMVANGADLADMIQRPASETPAAQEPVEATAHVQGESR